MSAAEIARQTLELASLNLPASPRVLQIDVEDYVDATGEDALRIDLLLDDSTTDEELGDGVARIKQIVFDRLQQAGLAEFPYIFVAKPSELAEVEDEA